MIAPIIILSGGAGSGKDTVAEMLCKGRNGVMLAQADPMKQFAKAVFGFTTEQLWGPSSARNAEDMRYSPTTPLTKSDNWDRAQNAVSGKVGSEWLQSLCLPMFHLELAIWFGNLRKDFENRTLTPRACLQTLGTEFGRKVSPDIWNHYSIKMARALLLGGYRYDREVGVVPDSTQYGYNFAVITDGRFRNEILNVIEVGGAAIKIINPVDESRDVDAAGVRGHTSESELKRIPDSWFLVTLVNDKSQGLDALEEKVAHLGQPFMQAHLP